MRTKSIQSLQYKFTNTILAGYVVIRQIRSLVAKQICLAADKINLLIY